MTHEEEMALRELAAKPHYISSVQELLGPLSLWSAQGMQDHVRKAVEAEREACAKVAGELHQRYLDTKDAHEKLSAKPFMPERFGFDHALIWNSQKMADAIRARGNT